MLKREVKRIGLVEPRNKFSVEKRGIKDRFSVEKRGIKNRFS